MKAAILLTVILVTGCNVYAANNHETLWVCGPIKLNLGPQDDYQYGHGRSYTGSIEFFGIFHENMLITRNGLTLTWIWSELRWGHELPDPDNILAGVVEDDSYHIAVLPTGEATLYKTAGVDVESMFDEKGEKTEWPLDCERPSSWWGD